MGYNEGYSFEKLKKEGVKIGARILQPGIMKNLLPDYENIYVQIKEFRKQAAIVSKENDEINSSYIHSYERRVLKELANVHYNIISILGGRGNGKTSTLLTLKYNISMNGNPYILDGDLRRDFILPLIIPDYMGVHNDPLGWVINYLENEMEEMEEIEKNTKKYYYHDYHFDGCGKSNKSEVSKALDELKKAYEYRQELYINNLFGSGVRGDSDFIKYRDKITTADIELREKFSDYIGKLIKKKRELFKNEEDIEHEPMIFIFFDDVDISIEKCFDVLDTVLKFLTHPNVVIFISGDYCVFYETLTIEFLKKSGLNEKSLLDAKFLNYVDKSALNSKQELSREYLKKVMPAAYRYKMPVLNDEQKINFKYYDDSKNSLGLNSNKELGEYNLKELIEYNFNENGDFKWTNLYLDIFDNKPRGLINVYVYLYRKAKEIERGEREREEIWSLIEIKRFIDILISSNDELSEYEEAINKFIYLINIQEKSRERIIINYDYLYSLFESLRKRMTMNKNLVLEKIINMLILGIFIEKIMMSINNKEQLGSIYTDKKLKNPISKFINMFDLNKKINNKLIEETNELEFIMNFYNDFKGYIRSNYVDDYSCVDNKENVEIEK